MATTQLPGGLKPLKIKCTDSDCASDLHCFKATQKMKQESTAGACRSCGAELVDWDRVHSRRLDDANFTFSELRRELIRHHFWHIPFDEVAINHAKRKGRTILHEAAARRINASVMHTDNPREGRQTPMEGNTIYYAQHATASCCRRCIEYWHGIPTDRDLTDEEARYLTTLVIDYLDERLPDLADNPVRVPPRRRGPGGSTSGT